MAVMKSRTSRARTKRRQTINMKLEAPAMVECGSCGNRIRMHHVCPKCGFYRGKQVIVPESKV